jgi:hypothetical protein
MRGDRRSIVVLRLASDLERPGLLLSPSLLQPLSSQWPNEINCGDGLPVNLGSLRCLALAPSLVSDRGFLSLMRGLLPLAFILVNPFCCNCNLRVALPAAYSSSSFRTLMEHSRIALTIRRTSTSASPCDSGRYGVFTSALFTCQRAARPSAQMSKISNLRVRQSD